MEQSWAIDISSFTMYTISVSAEGGALRTVIKHSIESQKYKELSERWHSCECGCSLDRDHNAAINILRLGRSRQLTQAG